MLLLPRDLRDQMVAHCLDGYPLEACGLLAGRPGEPGRPGDPGNPKKPGQPRATRVEACYPTGNAAHSARIFTVEPRQMLAADRDAEANGWELVGVWHSHTHTEARPSPTDVAQAPDPGWHYVVVSLRDVDPSLRSFRIADGKIAEEPVVVQ